MKTLRVSFFSLMLVKLMKIKLPHFLIAVLAQVQGALRRKRMTASFVEHFRKIIKIQYASTSGFHNLLLSQDKCCILYVCSTGLFKGCIDFQSHVAKLSQQRCFIQSVYYTRLCTGCSTKKQLIASFIEHIKGTP